ncbi:hypothetical protein H4Q32_025812 [Labeo rohita]|uniref:Uncharacterized protein n=1 Tax=Labeo rohita TaxID=84645 RepID=A0ABQ8MWF7_LABRO|nr:hypothetical protein H4Q32_025812 [Labeo rohita]
MSCIPRDAHAQTVTIQMKAEAEEQSNNKGELQTENGSGEKSDLQTENGISEQDSSESETYSEYVPSDGESTADEKIYGNTQRHAEQRWLSKEKGESVRSTAACLLPLVSETTAGVRTLLMNMRDDSVTKAIMEDRLIMLYGESIYTKCGHDRAQHPYINFVLAITACKEVSSYNADSNLFKTPSLALKIGYSLKKACQISLGQSLMSGDTETERNVKNFIKLIDSHWRTNISSKALNTLQQAKWNKGDTIPLTEDVMALQKHLRKQESKEKLRKNANTADWKVLAETLLCQIILFNRRREREASKLLLTVYEKRNVKPPNQDVVKSLTKLEQLLCSELTRLEIRGKRGKKVPVLLTKDMVDSMFQMEAEKKLGSPKTIPMFLRKLSVQPIFVGQTVYENMQQCVVPKTQKA